MPNQAKRKALLFLGLAVLIIAFLATSLSQLNLQPGLPLPDVEGGILSVPPDATRPVYQLHINSFLVTLLNIIFGALILYMLYQAIRGVNWKKIIRDFFLYIVLIVIGVGLLFLFLTSMPNPQGQAGQLPIPTPLPTTTVPLGTPPPWLNWLAAIGLAVCLALIGVWIIRSRKSRSSVVENVEREAEKARLAILAGVGLKDVILRCYHQMSLALQQEQGIERETYMTTGEFERLLVERGIPYEPVHQLTQLFNAVRYGHWQPQTSDEQSALTCLEAIVRFSQQGKEAV